MEAQILQQQGLTGLELPRHLDRDLAHAIRRERDVLRRIQHMIQQDAQPDCHEAAGSWTPPASLRPTKMGAEDYLRLVAQRVFDRGQGLADTGVIGDRHHP